MYIGKTATQLKIIVGIQSLRSIHLLFTVLHCLIFSMIYIDSN